MTKCTWRRDVFYFVSDTKQKVLTFLCLKIFLFIFAILNAHFAKHARYVSFFLKVRANVVVSDWFQFLIHIDN